MKKLVYIAVSIAWMQVAVAQNSAPLQNTLLWRITGLGLSRPSYLFGTMHVLCSDDAKLSDSLQRAIGLCDEVYFEIDLDDMSGMLASLQYMRMTGDQKLSDLLDTNDYEKVKNYFAKHVSLIPFSMLERFKPLLISSLIEEDGMDCKSTDAMEMVIMRAAHQQDKKINGLETAQFQAGLFDSIPYKQQAIDLVKSIDSVDENKKMTEALVEVYKKQELDKIEELTRGGDPSIGDYLDLLLYGRNRKWVTELQTILPQKSILMAVGAGHLPGDQGVINLLRKKGYTVSPVTQ